MNNLAIQLTNVSKKYILHHRKPTLVETLFQKQEEFWALQNISFSINRKERLGIIGRNGAGKSTLLKIISAITTPTTGQVKSFGRMASLIELTAGFHPDLTGEENIYINGLLLGMGKEEISRKFRNIVDFSELQHFIDSPFYTYSHGMMLRLGFSIAVHSNPDILILDEVFSAGDRAFQQKSQEKIKELLKEKTLLFVSHELATIKKLCPQTLWLDKGLIKSYGKTDGVINAYLKFSQPNST